MEQVQAQLQRGRDQFINLLRECRIAFDFCEPSQFHQHSSILVNQSQHTQCQPNSPPLEGGKLILREKAPKLEFFVTVEKHSEDLDVNVVLFLVPITSAMYFWVPTAQQS